MWGKKIVISKSGGEYQIPSLLKSQDREDQEYENEDQVIKRPTINLYYDQDFQFHDEYQDGRHYEPQDDHGYQDNDNEIDRHDQKDEDSLGGVDPYRCEHKNCQDDRQ